MRQSLKRKGIFMLNKKKFEMDFCKETIDMLVLIKEGCCGGAYVDDKTLRCMVKVLAYADPTTGSFYSDSGNLVWFAKENCRRSGYGFNFSKYGIYKVRVRKHLTDEWKYLLVKILRRRVHHPELDALREQYKKPVLLETPLGSFTLDRSFSWFERYIDLNGDRAAIYLKTDTEDGDTAEKALAIFGEICGNLDEFEQKVRLAAADELLENANDWAADGCEEGEEPEEITRESFAERIELDSISIDADGEITLFYDDDDIFLGHSIVVTADASDKVSDATLMG